MAIRFPFQHVTAPMQLLIAAVLNIFVLAFLLSPGDGGGWLPSSRMTEAAAGQAASSPHPRTGLDVLDDAPPRTGWEPPIVKEVEAAPKQQQVVFELQMPAPATRERAPERPASIATQPPAPSSVQVSARPAATEVPQANRAAAASTPIAPQQTGPEPVAASVRETGLIAAMNAARGREGLAPLRPHPTLMSAARSRTTDMLAHNYFAHIGPSGQSWYTALANSGWPSVSGGGENLARVSGDDASSVAVAIQKLMESPTHRANIMNPAFRLVGVGADTSGAGATIFTTIFTDR